MPTKINDQYWLDLAEKLVSDASGVRNTAAEKLASTITWFWTIYTAAVTIGATFAKLAIPLPVLVLGALPSLILVLAYWFAIRAQMPVDISFDPRAPDDIRAAYTAAVRQKAAWLKRAVLASIAAALSVAIALFLLSVTREAKEKPPEPPATVHLDAGVVRDDDKLWLWADVDSVDGTALRANYQELRGKKRAWDVVLNPEAKKARISVALPSDLKGKLAVRAQWSTADGSTRSIGRVVDVPEKESAEVEANEKEETPKSPT